MKKNLLIALVVACLGTGAGIYTAQQTDMFSVTTKVKEWLHISPKTYYVKHPSWTGTFTRVDDNRIYLDFSESYATILSEKDGILTVKWDKWGTESFKCTANNKCTFIKPEKKTKTAQKTNTKKKPDQKAAKKVYSVNHPKWVGKFLVLDKNRLYLEPNNDYGTIKSDKNGIITVKWDRWGTESFKCQKNACTFLKDEKNDKPKNTKIKTAQK